MPVYEAKLLREDPEVKILEVDIRFETEEGNEAKAARKIARKIGGVGVESVHKMVVYHGPGMR